MENHNSNRNILVFGATGATGFQIAKQLLESGSIVTVVVRNPSTFLLSHKNLIIIKGDVMNSNTFSESIKNQDVIISALGTGTSLKPTKVYSQGVDNIMIEMKRQDKSRLLCISAGGLEVNPTMNLFMRFLVKNILQRILKHPYADMRIMESEVKSSSLDYTIIRPPRLTNQELTGKYRTEINSNLKKASKIGRADLANGIIKLIDNKQSYKAIIEIAY
ncbi:MAG: NAD(P)H-binding protein [Bacteroidia bacterium]